MTTDLSSCFDVVHHRLLIKRLTFYSLNKDAIMLMQSYLGYRSAFVKIQGSRSKDYLTPDASVIQGAKNSCPLYNVFNIESLKLNEIMRKPKLYKTITGKDIERDNAISHSSVSYVDDTSHIIGGESFQRPKKYLQNFFDLLVVYHKENKLKMNPEKTKIMMMNHRNKQESNEKMTIKVENDEEVKEENMIKILGFYTNKDNNL